MMVATSTPILALAVAPILWCESLSNSPTISTIVLPTSKLSAASGPTESWLQKKRRPRA